MTPPMDMLGQAMRDTLFETSPQKVIQQEADLSSNETTEPATSNLSVTQITLDEPSVQKEQIAVKEQSTVVQLKPMQPSPIIYRRPLQPLLTNVDDDRTNPYIPICCQPAPKPEKARPLRLSHREG